MSILLSSLFSLVALSAVASAAEPVERPADTNEYDVVRSFLLIQEQIHATQMAIEAMRKEADESANRNASAQANNARFIETRIKGIEDSLSHQRALEMEALKASNRLTLMVAGSLAVLGIGAMLLTAFFQWRTVNRLTETGSSHANWRAVPSAPAIQVLGPGEVPVSGAAEQSSQRLVSALEQLEKRILGLEQNAQSEIQVPADNAVKIIGGNGNGNPTTVALQQTQPGTPAFLIAQGDTCFQRQDFVKALESFEETLHLEPDNCDVLIRKGATLEKLGRLNEAITCYDVAITCNSSLTIAYLHKGGVLNRMERFAEALECYEKALHTQNA